jgi:anthranilate phosphoribosyltransferase
VRVLFEEEAGLRRHPLSPPPGTDAVTTAAWIRRAMAGEHSMPHPIVNQLACCLYACGYTDDLNQAKALAMVEASRFASHSGKLDPAVN